MTDDLRGDKYIDGRDLLARLAELRDEREALIDVAGECDHLADETQARDEDGRCAACMSEVATWDEENGEELAAYAAIEDEISKDSRLIREDEFEDYARQLAEDIGAIGRDTAWPATCIDWERAAHELSADYTMITLDGTDYYVQD